MFVRRSALLLALAAASSLLAASPALAQGRAGMRGSALLGFEDGDGPAGLALRVDGELAQRPIGNGVSLSLVGSLGYSRFSDEGGAYDFFYGYDARWEQSLGLLKIIPAARFTFGRHPRVHPYADAGLGLYHASWSYSGTTIVDVPTYPYWAAVSDDFEDSEFGIVLRLAGGIAFEVSPGLSLGAELDVMPYVGDMVDDTTLSLLFGAQLRL
jgi:opacity protein-like surface antigen